MKRRGRYGYGPPFGRYSSLRCGHGEAGVHSHEQAVIPLLCFILIQTTNTPIVPILHHKPSLSTERARLVSEERSSELLRLRAVSAVRKSELQVLVREHDVLVSSQLLVRHHGGLDDLDRSVASAVGSSHLLVTLLHSTEESRVTVLLVHVVSARARVVAEPDAVVLHFLVRLVNLPTSPTTRPTRTSFTERISPVPFFIFSSLCMKYQ